jgi:hypothetical protein
MNEWHGPRKGERVIQSAHFFPARSNGDNLKNYKSNANTAELCERFIIFETPIDRKNDIIRWITFTSFRMSTVRTIS